MTSATATKKPSTKKPRRMAREPQAKSVSAQSAGEQPTDESDDNQAKLQEAPKPPIKSAIIVGLLTRSQGVTLQEMVDATGWLPHTTRAALTGLKKKGYVITSEKVDGVRTYRAVDKVEPSKPLEGEDSPVAGS